MYAAYSLACSLLLILANTRRILIHGLIRVIIRQGEFLLPTGLLVDFPVRGLVVSAAVVDLLAARAGLQARHGPADCAARTASSSARRARGTLTMNLGGQHRHHGVDQLCLLGLIRHINFFDVHFFLVLARHNKLTRNIQHSQPQPDARSDETSGTDRTGL